MQLTQLNEILKGKIYKDCLFNNIKTNSKDICKNDLFLAINSGNKYIEDAIKNGASCIISNLEINNVPNIKVDNPIKALGLIANYLRKKYNPKVIGITGSNGKTTTKELIYLILNKKYNVLKSNNNKNNNIGLPLTLLNLNDNHEIVILELGMNHFNEISELSKICLPDYGIITNIGSAHIGNLGSKNNILHAKLEILDGMKNNNLLINNNDLYLNRLNNTIKVDEKNLNINNLKYKEYLTFEINNVKFKINLPIHLKDDLFLAIKIGLLFDIPLNDISDAIKDYKPLNGRLNIIKKEYTIIDDCYNCSYESLIGGLKYINKFKNHKYIVLGDMLELGKYSIYYHKKINKFLKKIKNKTILLIGDYTKYIEGIHFDNIEEIKDYLLINLNLNDYVYIKGSNKMNLKKILDYI